jgi:hypothetical protein
MSAAVFYPVTGNYFFSDDFLHFWQIVNDGVGRFLLRMHGGHMYLTRNLLLFGFYNAFGLRAAPYFWIALSTHLLNVGLLYWLVSRLTGSWRIGCVSAGLWGIAPINVGALGWFAVYGHVLACTCALIVLVGLAGVHAGKPMSRHAPWIWGLVTLIGATCFGTGIAVASALPIVAWLLVPPGRQRWIAVAVLTGTAVAVVALYYGQVWLYEWLYAEAPQSGSLADVEHYWWAHLVSAASLLGYGVVCVVLGALHRASDYPGLRGYAVVAAVLTAAVIALVRAPSRTVRPFIACLIIAAAGYGLISAGRALIESLTAQNGLEGAARYHYLTGTMIAAMVGLVLLGLSPARVAPAWANAALIGWAGTTLLVALRWGPPIFHFEFARRETAYALDGIARAVGTAPPGADVYVPNKPFRSVGFLMSYDVATFPGWAAVFAITHPDGLLDGHRVYFVMPEDELTKVRERGGREVAALLRSAPAPNGS